MGEATESIAFALPLFFLLPFSTQKSHVKPQNHLNHCHTATSAWHFSYTQTAILDIEIKTEQVLPCARANSFRKNILDATHLLSIFCKGTPSINN
jgi:hypothetical protein